MVAEHLLGKTTISAQASEGTDMVSLKWTEDGKGIQMLTAASVAAGETEASNPLAITSDDKKYLAAASAGGTPGDGLAKSGGMRAECNLAADRRERGVRRYQQSIPVRRARARAGERRRCDALRRWRKSRSGRY